MLLGLLWFSTSFLMLVWTMRTLARISSAVPAQTDGWGRCPLWRGGRSGTMPGVRSSGSWGGLFRGCERAVVQGVRVPRAEIIAHAVWLYHRFPVSYREVEELVVRPRDHRLLRDAPGSGDPTLTSGSALRMRHNRVYILFIGHSPRRV
jgi:hypothetical protein